VPLPRGAKTRAPEALARLRRRYGAWRSYLDHETPFQLLVAVALSAQTPDALTNKVTPELFRRWPDAASLAEAHPDDVLEVIRPLNFSYGKSRRLVAAARMVRDEFGGEVPRAMEDLVKIPGVGRKTANVVQGHAWRASEGVAVDTHVKRVAFRLGLTANEDPVTVERDLNRLYPKEHYPLVNFYFIAHGRATCTARRPACPDCVLADICPKRGVEETRPRSRA